MSDALCSFQPAEPHTEVELARDENAQNRVPVSLPLMLKTQLHSIWEGDLGHGLVKGKWAQCLGPRAPRFLRILPWLPGDLTNGMGSVEAKTRVSNGTSSRIFCSANVHTPEKMEALMANDSQSNLPGSLGMPVCLKLICGCA